VIHVKGVAVMMRLYQVEWCPYCHRVRAKLTELGLDYEAVNVAASGEGRAEVKGLTGGNAVPVLVDGGEVISDSGKILSYLEENYRAEPEELKLHRRELSPTVYGSTSLSPGEAVGRLRAALLKEGIEVLDELDLSPLLDREGVYKVLLAADREFLELSFAANPGAAALAVLKIAVYQEDGSTRIDAVEPEKAAQQIRDPRVNDRGLELRKLLIRIVKSLKREGVGI
jgi:glutaredoxin/uncharacterized protein (DUF302 family)